jgi:hypothetical protein
MTPHRAPHGPVQARMPAAGSPWSPPRPMQRLHRQHRHHRQRMRASPHAAVCADVQAHPNRSQEVPRRVLGNQQVRSWLWLQRGGRVGGIGERFRREGR